MGLEDIYREPYATRIREAAYRLACVLTDAVPDRTLSRAAQEEAVLRRILALCAPKVQVILPQQEGT